MGENGRNIPYQHQGAGTVEVEAAKVLFKFDLNCIILIQGVTMNVPKIYLETTMFSFYHEKRIMPPYLELKAEVHRIFELIKAGVFQPLYVFL
jgi:hypothetical protein